MSGLNFPWRTMATVGAVALLTGCGQMMHPASVASNPPPVSPGPDATWYHIGFLTGSHSLDAQGEMTVADVTSFLQRNPDSVATIIGKTDTVGSANYNMHLSHQRADTVRDALVYHSNVAADRVETRWTGETRQDGGNVSGESNRVVDIAIH